MTITDAHLVLGRIPPHLLGGEIPLDMEAARSGLEALSADLGLSPEACATGVLEISAWNQANALRQVTVKRGLDVRDFTLTTFGGSGSLLLCRLMDVLGIRTVLVPPNPGNVSAFGLLTVDVNERLRADPRRPRRRPRPRPRSPRRTTTSPSAPPPRWRPGLRAWSSTSSSARPTCATSVRPSRCGSASPRARSTRSPSTRSRTASTPSTRSSTATTFSSDSTQQVEWVNLRVSGIGPIQRPEIRRQPASSHTEELSDEPGDSPSVGLDASRPVCFDAHDGYVDTPLYARTDLRPGARVTGPAVIEEFGSTVPVHPGFEVRVDEFLNLIVTRSES